MEQWNNLIQKVKKSAMEELHIAETARVFIIHQMREQSLDIYEYYDIKKDKHTILTENIPWDVSNFSV